MKIVRKIAFSLLLVCSSMLFIAPSLYGSERESLKVASPLHVAIEKGLYDSVPDLLAVGMNIEARGYVGWTVLHAICLKRERRYAPKEQNAIKECIKILLDHAPSSLINEKDSYDNSPFYYLLPTKDRASDPDLFAMFLNYGADPNIHNMDEETCLDTLEGTLKGSLRGYAQGYIEDLFSPTYKILCVIDEHDKQIEKGVREDIIDQSLSDIMSKDITKIISGYACCGIKLNPKNRQKLNAILSEHDQLFKSLPKKVGD